MGQVPTSNFTKLYASAPLQLEEMPCFAFEGIPPLFKCFLHPCNKLNMYIYMDTYIIYILMHIQAYTYILEIKGVF